MEYAALAEPEVAAIVVDDAPTNQNHPIANLEERTTSHEQGAGAKPEDSGSEFEFRLDGGVFSISGFGEIGNVPNTQFDFRSF